MSNVISLTEEEIALIEKYKDTGLMLGNPDFFKYWRALMTERYIENKKKGLPDPLDVFYDYKGPVIKK